MTRAALALTAVLGGAATPAAAQVVTTPAESSTAVAAVESIPPRPWRVGERLVYTVKFGLFNVGRATMEVVGIDTVRGVPVWHILFNIRGKALTYSLNDSMQSWFGVHDLVSRRFIQDTEERGRTRFRSYEIFPEAGFWVRDGRDTAATVADPLDDASFFFFARTIPLEPGRTYTFARYFVADRNPVTIRVLQRQEINTPAGRFRTIAVRPVFQSRGLLGQGGHAILWLSDDEARIPVRMRSALPVGTIEMSLRERR
jgi:hypothetical protein